MKALMDCEGKKIIVEESRKFLDTDPHDDMLMDICDQEIDIIDHSSQRKRHPQK